MHSSIRNTPNTTSHCLSRSDGPTNVESVIDETSEPLTGKRDRTGKKNIILLYFCRLCGSSINCRHQ